MLPNYYPIIKKLLRNSNFPAAKVYSYFVRGHAHAFFFAMAAYFGTTAAIRIIMGVAFGSAAAAGAGAFLEDFSISGFGNDALTCLGALETKLYTAFHSGHSF